MRQPAPAPPPEPEAAIPACPNCEAPAPGEFCARCGQRQGPLQPTLRELLGEFVEEALNLDSKILRTLSALFRPGLLTREFLAGRRRRYVSPFRLYLAMSVVMFGAIALSPLQKEIDRAGGQGTKVQLGSGLMIQSTDPDVAFGNLAKHFHGRFGEHIKRFVAGGLVPTVTRLQKAYVDYGPKADVLALPAIALLLLLLYRKSAYRYPAHLVFALHYQALYFACAIVSTTLAALAPHWLATTVGIAVTIYTWSWALLALRAVYGGSRGGTFFRGVGLLVGQGVVQAALTAGMIFLAIWNT